MVNELVKTCSAYASCNTTATEFTISVDYTTGTDTTKKTYYFPYTPTNDSTTKDTITSKTEGAASCPTSMNSIILSSGGCYNCAGINEKKMYMTEWSFPGTWIHNKTGKISYEPVTDSSWRMKKEKFCLPLNVGNVNAKWYNYYQAKLNGDDTSYSYNSTEYITNIVCPDGSTVKNLCQYKSTTFDSTDAEDITYNINATTRGFGMYEWDIDIACFYATNDQFPKVDKDDNCKTLAAPCDGDGEQKMRVRTVDLENLFPNANGDKLPSSSTTGRTVPFNWSTYAEQTQKDPDYASVPANYTKWVQKMGTGVYSDRYLDYEVNLTKEIINEIRKEFNSGTEKKYTAWEGTVDVNNVTNYRSPLFRNGGILSKNSKYPVGDAIKCNNMKNYGSTECEDFTGEVE